MSFVPNLPVQLTALAVLIISILSPLHAEAQSDQVSFADWLVEFRAEALAAGISEMTLEHALAGLELRESILEDDRNQPEFKRTLDEYLANAINRFRIIQGRKFLREEWQLFADIAKEYPVQSRFLVALWGIETNFGRNQGKVPIIQALATLAYDPRRSEYFTRELIAALRILDQQSATLAQMYGSWAGAMGQVQFMPSVFLKYAVDFDNDGRIDLWQSRPDALASAARYLTSLGWKKNWTWGREVRVPADFDSKLEGLDHQLRLAEWQKLGVRRLNGGDLPDAPGRASLIRPDGSAGRSFLVYDNYRKIMNWNRSHSFAIAVGLLSDEIGKP